VIAASGSTCERIVHLASYPVDCYELVVRSSDHTLLRESLVEVARDAESIWRSSERVCIGAPSISS